MFSAPPPTISRFKARVGVPDRLNPRQALSSWLEGTLGQSTWAFSVHRWLDSSSVKRNQGHVNHISTKHRTSVDSPAFCFLPLFWTHAATAASPPSSVFSSSLWAS